MYQYPNVMISPGKMMSGHRALDQKCLSCHEPFWGISNDKCISCHKLSEIGKSKDSINKQNKVAFHNSFKNQNCISCHTEHKGIKPILQYVGFNHDLIVGLDKSNCSSCHEKPKDEFHGSIKDMCSKCHNTGKWVPTSFDHSKKFPLDENHSAKCNTCHPDNNFIVYNCFGCHEHSETKMREAHNEEGIKNFGDCISCHKVGNKQESDED